MVSCTQNSTIFLSVAVVRFSFNNNSVHSYYYYYYYYVTYFRFRVMSRFHRMNHYVHGVDNNDV